MRLFLGVMFCVVTMHAAESMKNGAEIPVTVLSLQQKRGIVRSLSLCQTAPFVPVGEDASNDSDDDALLSATPPLSMQRSEDCNKFHSRELRRQTELHKSPSNSSCCDKCCKGCMEATCYLVTCGHCFRDQCCVDILACACNLGAGIAEIVLYCLLLKK